MATIRPARLNDLPNIEYVCRMTAGTDARENEKIGLAVAKTFSTYYVCECTDICFVLADDNAKPWDIFFVSLTTNASVSFS